MLPDKNIKCPATGFAKTCHSIVTKCTCPKWIKITGQDPQSGAILDHYGCVDTFLPKLLIDIAKQCNEAGASIDRFNNDMVRMNGIVSAVQAMPMDLPGAASQTLLAGPQLDQVD